MFIQSWSWRIARVLAVVVAALLSACAASGPKYETMASSLANVEPGKARMFFLRPSQFQAGGAAAPIAVDGRAVGELPNGAFFYVDIESGEHTAVIDRWDYPGKFTLVLTLQPGETRYIEVAPRTSAVTAGAVGGMFGLVGTLTALNVEASGKENAGLFSMTVIEESSAKQKLAGLGQVTELENGSASRRKGLSE